MASICVSDLISRTFKMHIYGDAAVQAIAQHRRCFSVITGVDQTDCPGRSQKEGPNCWLQDYFPGANTRRGLRKGVLRYVPKSQNESFVN